MSTDYKLYVSVICSLTFIKNGAEILIKNYTDHSPAEYSTDGVIITIGTKES